MLTNTQFLNESSRLTTASDDSAIQPRSSSARADYASDQSNVIRIEMRAQAGQPAARANCTDIDDLVEGYEQDPEARKLLQEARQWLAGADAERGKPMRALRLRAGLSQANVAERIGTSQSHYARIENGKGGSVHLSTAMRIADVLQVSLPQVAELLLPKQTPKS